MNKLIHTFNQIKLDDKLAESIVNTEIFKEVNPNTITIFGIICNVLLVYFLYYPSPTPYLNNTIYFCLLLIRYLSDCLDGAVARKYQKTSKMGHILDTLSDSMLVLIAIISVTIKYQLPMVYCIIAVGIFLILQYRHDIFTTHDKVKDARQSNILVSFLVNNSYLLFIFYYFLIKND